jgi:hypothetical protein
VDKNGERNWLCASSPLFYFFHQFEDRVPVANAEMFAPIARAGVKDEPRIDFDNIIINGSVRYFGLVKQRQCGEALGSGHLVTVDPAASPMPMSIRSSSSGWRRFHDPERGNRL